MAINCYSTLIVIEHDPSYRPGEPYIPKPDQKVLPTLSIMPGDVLTIGYRDTEMVFDIVQAGPKSLVFGSQDIRDPTIVMRRRSVNGAPLGDEVELNGSARFPDGGDRLANAVRPGSYLIVDHSTSYHPIQTIRLQRSDKDGETRVVPLGQQEVGTESKSFLHAKAAFAIVRKQLEQAGFSFGESTDESLVGKFTKAEGNLLVGAKRLVANINAMHQDMLYAYDAKSEVLRGILNIAGRGIMQTMVAEGVTKVIFQDVFAGRNDNNFPDWRYPHLLFDPMRLNELSRYVPIKSYTWPSPDQEKPIITVLQAGEPFDPLLKTPMQDGRYIVKRLRKLYKGSENVSDEMLMGTDYPRPNERPHDRLLIDIHPGDAPQPRPGEPYIWNSAENAAEAAKRVKDATTLRRVGNLAVLNVGGHKITINMDEGAEIDQIATNVRNALRPSLTDKIIGLFR